MTIQQLLLTSSKDIYHAERAGKSSRGTGKKVLQPKQFEQRFQNVPITESVVYARRKNFQFFGTIFHVHSKSIFPDSLFH